MICESRINFLIPWTKNFFIFNELFFAKYNFKITCTDDIYLSFCLELNEWGLTMKEKFPETMRLYIQMKIVKIFFTTKQYFFLNSNPEVYIMLTKVRNI